MNNKQSNLHNLAIFVFIAILVLNGTYFRARSSADVPTLDWLILARLLVCLIGFVIGIILIPKKGSLRFGAKALLFYIFATGLSAIGSPMPKIVLGYFVLLLGSGTLMIALVYNSRSVFQLEHLEKIWFLTVAILVIKDSLISLFTGGQGEIGRIGMGVTHANQISFLSGLVFWVSFKFQRSNLSVIMWFIRVFLVFILLTAISRISILAFVMAGFSYFIFRFMGHYRAQMIMLAGIGFLGTFFLLSLSFGQEWSNDIVKYLKRGQEETGLTTFTGRTYIWDQAKKKAFESSIIGHGYGTTRFALGELAEAEFQAFHSHNDFLEAFLATGLIGFIPFLGIYLYSLKWAVNFSLLRKVFSHDLSLHAVCVVIMIFFASGFETYIAGKLSPVQPLFFLYLLSLDRTSGFGKNASASDQNGSSDTGRNDK